MPKVEFNQALKDEYKQLYATVRPREVKDAKGIVIISLDSVKKLVASEAHELLQHKNRYAAIAKQIGCPWELVAMMHQMECGGSFEKHLHNGDWLKARTIRVPAGRPSAPPADGKKYSFEESALDALRFKGIDKVKDWSVERVLYLLESYNGLGYRKYHADVKSPYLWSMSQHYTKGKYVMDGKYDPNTVSRQVGAALILKELGMK